MVTNLLASLLHFCHFLCAFSHLLTSTTLHQISNDCLRRASLEMPHLGLRCPDAIVSAHQARFFHHDSWTTQTSLETKHALPLHPSECRKTSCTSRMLNLSRCFQAFSSSAPGRRYLSSSHTCEAAPGRLRTAGRERLASPVLILLS